jgi:sugar (pentulose or hexulose) kinase
MLGKFNGSRLTLEELYRFSNEPVSIFDNLFWDVLGLVRSLKQGFLNYSSTYREPLNSVGIDTWGSDYGVLDRKGHLLCNPNHYRDRRTDNIVKATSEIMTEKEMFYLTGNATIKYNTVFQLLSMRPNQSTFFDNTNCLLQMPDLLTYFLTGEKAAEFTNATTSQMMGADRKSWCAELLKKLDIPAGILPIIQQPATLRGKLTNEIGKYTGVGSVPVIATSTHDTASAIAAIPGLNENSAFLSSGTWSLIGAEVRETYINDKVYDSGYSNEGGVEGNNLLLRNTVGIWILQECKREWDKFGDKKSYDDLEAMLEHCEAFYSFIDSDNNLFSLPGDMPAKIQQFCRETGQRVPESKGQIVRIIYESLALKYRWCLEKLEDILGRQINSLHIVGGGSKNRFLNQFTANSIKKPVYCGLTEATAIGNIMVQAMALGEVKNLAEIRQVVEQSFTKECFEPSNAQIWDDAYGKFLKIL